MEGEKERESGVRRREIYRIREKEKEKHKRGKDRAREI